MAGQDRYLNYRAPCISFHEDQEHSNQYTRDTYGNKMSSRETRGFLVNKKGFCFPKRARTSINVEYNYTHRESIHVFLPFCCHTLPIHLHGVLVPCTLSEQRSFRGNIACVFVFQYYLCSQEDKPSAYEAARVNKRFPKGYARSFMYTYNGEYENRGSKLAFKGNITLA